MSKDVGKKKRVARGYERKTKQMLIEEIEKLKAENERLKEENEGLRENNEKLKAENEGLRQRLLRTMADFDNYRKWVEKERKNLELSALEGVITDILPVLDSIDIAIQSMDEENKKGMIMLRDMMMRVLETRGVKPVGKVGEKFDPYKHEAVEVVKGDDDDVVVDVLRKGYTLGTKVIRCARVVVSKAENDNGGGG
ncbi:MAG: nucleotide exchange factor GrpE [Thermoplasmata archaeon]|nr:MAG: nucleotide exchange factor GrpE [Thermoplasmata archaeon]